eukprot:Phypoly_transcript_00754.p1 GENE.Phypoly_transcript_00754~~Phypoly_transcript_00754.p1  ORF type:complete len:757 (-),score=295.54 Phypoly_transcript_00754:143-2413(-)
MLRQEIETVKQNQLVKEGEIKILKARASSKEHELTRLRMEKEQKEESMKKELSSLQTHSAFQAREIEELGAQLSVRNSHEKPTKQIDSAGNTSTHPPSFSSSSTSSSTSSTSSSSTSSSTSPSSTSKNGGGGGGGSDGDPHKDRDEHQKSEHQMTSKKDKEKEKAQKEKDRRNQDKEKEKEKEKDPVKEKEAEETVRRNARNNLSEALGNPTIAIAIEAEMFKQFPIKTMSKEYTAKARSLLFNLRDPKNATLKERTLSGAITPQRFVSMRPEEYASGELAEWRRQQEAKAMQSISILPEEDEEAQAQKLNEMVQRQIEAEQKAADGNGAVNGALVKSEDVGKYLSREGEEEDSVKKEKELVDIDINIADNPNLAAPLALPLPLPIPTPGAAASLPLPPLPSANAAAAATAASTTLITPLPPSVSVPIWKGEFDKIAVGVEPFSVRGYHLGGPHVDTLLARVASVTARGKLEVTKLSDYITEKIDSSPHRTRSLILIEPAATNDDEAYEMTWEYCNNNRSPAVVCGITPPVPEDEEATVPRLDQMYIVPLATPEEIPDFLFPPNMTSSARKINLRAAGQRSSARNCYMLAIVVTKLPDPSKKSKPETPSRADSPNPNPVPIPSPNPNPNAPLLPNPPISPSSMNPIFNSPPHTQPPQQAQQQAHQQQMYNMQQQAQYGNQQGPNYNLPSPSQMYQQNNMYQQQNPNFPQFQNNYQQFNNSNNFPPHQPLPPPIFNPGNNQFFNQYNNNFQQQNYKP